MQVLKIDNQTQMKNNQPSKMSNQPSFGLKFIEPRGFEESKEVSKFIADNFLGEIISNMFKYANKVIPGDNYFMQIHNDKLRLNKTIGNMGSEIGTGTKTIQLGAIDSSLAGERSLSWVEKLCIGLNGLVNRGKNSEEIKQYVTDLSKEYGVNLKFSSKNMADLFHENTIDAITSIVKIINTKPEKANISVTISNGLAGASKTDGYLNISFKFNEKLANTTMDMELHPDMLFNEAEFRTNVNNNLDRLLNTCKSSQ